MNIIRYPIYSKHIFMADLLRNIHEVDSSMNIETNGGILTTNQKGFLNNFVYVWYHPDAITNILSIKSAINKYRFTLDSAKDNVFHVHKPNEIINFTASNSGLYYHDSQNRNVVFLDQVDRQYERAVKARELYTKIGCPSIND